MNNKKVLNEQEILRTYGFWKCKIHTHGLTHQDERLLHGWRLIQHTIGEAFPKFFLEDAAETSQVTGKFLKLG
jgi:hypothetical protein